MPVVCRELPPTFSGPLQLYLIPESVDLVDIRDVHADRIFLPLFPHSVTSAREFVIAQPACLLTE